MRSKPSRGLQDIRTMSGRISEEANPQRKYLTLAILELEKARRSQERESARGRIENIDQRLAEIAEEEAGLLTAAEADLAEAPLAKRSDREGDPESPARQDFKLTY
jgi:hypothetical protein